MTTPDAAAPPSPLITDRRRQRAVLLAICAALMAVIASVSGLNVAQREVAIAFGASQGTVIWIINAYTVALAAMLLPVGAVGDRWGRRPVLLAGLALFVLSSVGSALAPTAGAMIAARLACGVAAAMIMPVTLSVITSTFPEEDRSQAIGVWTAVAGGGGLLGMFAAALLVDLSSWRWLFAPVVVLACAAFAMVSSTVPDSRDGSAEPFDLAGALLSVVAVGGSVLAIHEGPTRGWTSPATLALLAAGMAAAAAFAEWERRRREPLLDVRVFGDRRLASGSLALVGAFAVLGGIMVVLFLHFQAVLGWSALRSMGGMMPMALAMMASSGLAPKVTARLGLRGTMLLGVGVAAAGLGGMAAWVSVAGGYLSVLPGMLVMAAGFGLAMTPSTEAITRALPAARQGVASALNDVTRELGTALGVASLGAVLSAGYGASIRARLAAHPREVTDAVAEGIGTAGEVAARAADPAAILAAAKDAFVDGWSQAMWVGLGVTAALFVFLLLRGPSSSPGAPARAGDPARAG